MKLNSVQYLRATAILLVVAFHASGHLGDVRPTFDFLKYGQYGVDLFFVISGFIMAVTTTSTSSASSFAARRLWRIVPLYWLVTLAYVAILLVAPDLVTSAALNFGHVLKSFLFIPSYNPTFPDLIWPLVIPGWSLNYELYFYAIFAISLFVSARDRHWIASLILLLLVVLGQIISTKNPVIITYTNILLLEFVFGIIVGAVFLNERASHTRALSLIFCLVAVASIVCMSLGITVWRSVLYGSISATILSFLISFEQSGVIFSNVALIGIGDASYSIYLTHPAIIGSLRRIGDAIHFKSVGAPLELGALLVALVGSSLFGWLIFTKIERPIMGWRNKFLRRNPAGFVEDVKRAELT